MMIRAIFYALHDEIVSLEPDVARPESGKYLIGVRTPAGHIVHMTTTREDLGPLFSEEWH